VRSSGARPRDPHATVPLMALFRVGDHVALADRADERLRITEIVDDNPAGATYLVVDDEGATVTLAEAILIRYGSSVD